MSRNPYLPPTPRPPKTYTVEKVTFGGDGMVRDDGKIGFIPFTLAGEIVEATIEKEKKDFFNAKLERLNLASPHRVEPPCPYFSRCGGCAYQHTDYPSQLTMKQAQVTEVLLRVGGFANLDVRPIVASPKTYGYRNRITVHRKDGRIGFMARNRHHLVDIRECLIAQDSVNDALAALRRSNNDDTDITLRAPETPWSFSQVNDFAVPLLLEAIGALLNPAHTTLVDAYSGTGLYSRHFAPRYQNVVGIEWSQAGVRRARESAKKEELVHVQFEAGDVAEFLPAVLEQVNVANTTLIINPPAVGMEQIVVEMILSAPPAEIVYISCNPATLARDLKRLSVRYELLSATPVDLFPQTAEVEVVTHLRLR